MCQGKQAETARWRATLYPGQHTDQSKAQPEQNGAIEEQHAALQADASRPAEEPEQPPADVASETHGDVTTASSTEAQPGEAHAPAEPAVPTQLSDTQSSSLAALPAAATSTTSLDANGEALSKETANTGMPVAAEARHAAEAGTGDATAIQIGRASVHNS